MNRAFGDTRLPYLPGLDGLRALAVAAVFAYHAVGAPIAGGFLGVDIFFAISGYLITAGLLREWQQRQHIDIPGFWVRRARRLLPAALVLILAVLTAAVTFAPDDLNSARSAALAALAYVTNWYLILGNEPYFETVGRPSLLQHLWSLAVEEQFYLLWPLALYVALRWLRPAVVMGGIVLLAIGSSVLMYSLYKLGADPARLYYGTDTHATGLLAGSALAFVRPTIEDRRVRAALEVGGAVALLALVAAVIWFDESHPALYTGGLALVAVASGMVVITAAQPQTMVGRLLGLAPLRWLGMRSYSVYLWHWPVIMLARTQLDGALVGLPLLAFQIVVTIALAECSFRFIERPIRSGALGRIYLDLRRLPANPSFRGDSLFVGGACTAAAVALLLVTVINAPPKEPPAYLAAPAVHGVLVAAVSTPTAAPERTPIPEATLEATPESVVSAASSSLRSVAAADTAPEVSAQSPRLEPLAPGSEPIVTAIGDSVMLGAAEELARTFGVIDLDAETGRSAMDVVRTIRERQQSGRLTSTVIVQIGNNGLLTAAQVEQMMQPLAGVPRVLVMNVRVARPWEGPNGTVLAEVIRQHPNAQLIDWHTASAEHPEFFWDDQTHLRPEGAAMFAQLLADRVNRWPAAAKPSSTPPGS